MARSREISKIFSADTNIVNSSELTSGLVTASSAAVSALINGAPAALDTLNELSAALNNDNNFATTITNSLANKLNISSASTIYLTQASASSTYLPLTGGTVTGPITVSNRPSFNVWLSAGSYTTNQVVVFDQTLHNTGTHYNTSTGVFTAPYAGLYFFGGHIITPRNTTGGDLYWDLRINNNSIHRFYDGAEGGGSSVHIQAFGAATLQLSASDTITFYIGSSNKGAVTGNSLHCRFYGHFIG